MGNEAFARHQSGQLNDASGGYRRTVEAGYEPGLSAFYAETLIPACVHPSPSLPVR